GKHPGHYLRHRIGKSRRDGRSLTCSRSHGGVPMQTLSEHARTAPPPAAERMGSGMPQHEHEGGDATLFPVLQNDKIGYIDRTGHVVIAPQFGLDNKANFRVLSAITVRGSVEGQFPVLIGDSWDYMDNTGKVVTEAIFEAAGSFHDGLAPVK